MKTRVNDSALQNIVKMLATEFQPEKIILFGSLAKGNMHADSDVDLCVIKDTADTRSLAKKIDSSMFPRPFPIDLLVMTPKYVDEKLLINDYFVTEIIQKGKLLYVRQ